MHKNNLLLLLLLSTCFSVFSQSESFGTWTNISIDTKIKKIDLSAETELRTIYGIRLIDRWSMGLNLDYGLNKFLKIGAGYDLMNKLDTKYLNYQFRNRWNISTTGKLKINDFNITLREKLQLTTKDESNRIQADGLIDYYKINPELSWRNRLQIAYDIPKCRITPSASVESFYTLNNPDGNVFDKLRYTLNFDYKINTKNSIRLFGVLNSNIDSDEDAGKYIIGIAYKFSLK